MTAMYFPFRHFVSRSHGGRTACRAAADALEILSNLRRGFTRNVIPRISSSTAASVSQANSEERQVNDEELQANGSAVQSSTSPASSNSIQARLATLFPTVSSNRVSRKDTSRRQAKSKRTAKSTKGRPSKTLVYKNLVLIPSPKISKVPTTQLEIYPPSYIQIAYAVEIDSV